MDHSSLDYHVQTYNLSNLAEMDLLENTYPRGFCKTSGSTPKNAPEVLQCIIFSKTQKFCKRLPQ